MESDDTRTLPMFPLGVVLVPMAPLPLHVFEDRYRAMVADCMTGSREFGVVLIERGHEVGGGDARFGVGTLAHIVGVEELGDGRLLVATVGGARLRVKRWLVDDPYPRAEVEICQERPCRDALNARAMLEGAVERLLEVVERCGGPPAPTVVMDPDPIRAGYEALARAPFGVLDRQRVLAVDDPDERLSVLSTLLDDVADLMVLQHGDF